MLYKDHFKKSAGYIKIDIIFRKNFVGSVLTALKKKLFTTQTSDCNITVSTVIVLN